jgi:prepilin-type N-terminal cleavage/methylation domain-containing protein
MSQKHKKGFTLIELLVVISIISLLSSIVMTTLSGAKIKAKDAAIKMEVNQFTKLMDLEYNDNGSYCNLRAGWFTDDISCDNAFGSSIYKTEARSLCNSIYNKAKNSFGEDTGIHRLRSEALLFENSTLICSTAYSLTVSLNNGNWYCSGSSGRKSEGSWNENSPGCTTNP